MQHTRQRVVRDYARGESPCAKLTRSADAGGRTELKNENVAVCGTVRDVWHSGSYLSYLGAHPSGLLHTALHDDAAIDDDANERART